MLVSPATSTGAKMINLYRTYNGLAIYNWLRAVHTLDEALACAPLYENQGMAVAISGPDKKIVYLTAGVE